MKIQKMALLAEETTRQGQKWEKAWCAMEESGLKGQSATRCGGTHEEAGTIGWHQIVEVPECASIKPGSTYTF